MFFHLGDTVLNGTNIVRANRSADGEFVSVVVQDIVYEAAGVRVRGVNQVLNFTAEEARALWHALTSQAVDVQQDYDIHLHELHLQEQEAQHTRPLFREGMDVDPEILRNQGWQRALANFIQAGGLHSSYLYVQLNDAAGYSYHDDSPAPSEYCVVLHIPLRSRGTENERAAQMWDQLTELMHRRMQG